MGRSLTIGRRRAPLSPSPVAAADAPVPAAEPEDVQRVFEEVLELAAEPLAADGGLPPVRHARVGRTLADQRAGQIRERELAIMADSLAVVRDVTSALERGTAPAVAERQEHLEYARQQSREAFELARAIATRETPAPTFHMHMPEHRVDVNVEGADIRLPAPETHFHAGDTHVAVPEQPAPHVDVFVPVQEPTVVNVAPAAAHVHVDPAPVHVHAAAPSPTRGIRVEYDGQGNRVFVPVEVEPEETS